MTIGNCRRVFIATNAMGLNRTLNIDMAYVVSA